MTYQELLEAIQKMNEEQLCSDVTVEFGISDECFPAELRICDCEHEILDPGHPVIYLKDC